MEKHHEQANAAAVSSEDGLEVQCGWELAARTDSERADVSVVLQYLRIQGCALQYAAEELRDIRDVVMVAVRAHSRALQFASERLRGDAEVVQTAAQRDLMGECMAYASEDVLEDRSVTLTAVSASGDALRHYVGRAAVADPEITRVACASSGWALRFCATSCREDPETVLAAVRSTGFALQWAAPSLRGDSTIVEAALHSCGEAFRYALPPASLEPRLVCMAVSKYAGALDLISDECLHQSEVAVAAVVGGDSKVLRRLRDEKRRDINFCTLVAKGLAEASKSLQPLLQWVDSDALQDSAEFISCVAAVDGAAALHYASERLKANKDIVYIAVQQMGAALRLASENLRDDPAFMHRLVSGVSGLLLKYGTPRVCSDPAVVAAAVTSVGQALCHASEALRDHREIALLAVAQNGNSLQYVSSRLRADRDVVLAAVEQTGYALQHADEKLTRDRDVVIKALTSDGGALDLVDPCMLQDEELIKVALASDGSIMWLLPEEMRTRRDLVALAVGSSWQALGSAPPEFTDDRDIVMAAIRHDGFALDAASPGLQDDKSVVLEAMKSSGYYDPCSGEFFHPFEFVSDRLKEDPDVVAAAVAANADVRRMLPRAASSCPVD